MNAFTPLPMPRKVGLRAVDYLMLSDAGAFDHVGRTELIEGEIWAMNAVHSWHAKTTSDLVTDLTLALRSTLTGWRVFTAGSVLLADDSVPEPDIAIGVDNELGVLPLAKLKLAIEISDSTASIDLGVKLRIYAAAGVPEYWVVERDTRLMHQMWKPSGDSFSERRAIAFGKPVSAATLAGIEVQTGRLGGSGALDQ